MDDLFSMPDQAAQYPHYPGWKREETSARAAAAAAETAPILRAKCLAAIKAAPDGLTANEVADALGRDITSVRPRITELVKLEKVRKRIGEGSRRPTPSGCTALVWIAT